MIFKKIDKFRQHEKLCFGKIKSKIYESEKNVNTKNQRKSINISNNSNNYKIIFMNCYTEKKQN